MADPDSPSNHMSSADDVQQPSSNHQESTTNDWPWATDDQQQQNAIDSSGLMHLIATGGGGTTVDTNPNDESIGVLPTTDQVNDEQPVLSQEEEEEEEEEEEQEQDPIDENIPDEQQSQLPLVTIPSSSIPMDVMDTEPQDTPTDIDQSQKQQQPIKSQHDIAEIHREMLNLIPIPQAWSHIRHQSGLFSYPDLPHFNVIRQATFREGRFVCPFCTVDFASKEGIRYHLYNSCTKSPYPKAFFRCLMCGSELADRSSLRTHLARHGADEGSTISADKIDVSRKSAITTSGGTPNSKKSKKKKKNSNDLTPPQMINPMIALTSGISPRGIDTYNLPPTMLNQHMSLPIIKSEQNDNDPKRKRGRPPKTKSSDGPTPIANYTKHTHINPTGLILNPTMTNPLMLNDQLMKVNITKTKT
jgi:transposase-like protein